MPKPSTTTTSRKATATPSFYKDASGAKHPRVALGLSDLFRPDGGDHRTFEPLWWRTWRYLDIDITTADQPLTLESLKANFTAYPFEVRAKFDAASPASDPALAPDLAKIWDISWRTAQIEAHETFSDSPYYEQLQYIGDSRIEAMITYAVTGDGRLARQALEAFNDSRIPEGITRSRYPSSLPQNIPTFSLLWIGMLHDWWMYQPDPDVPSANRSKARAASSAGSRNTSIPTACSPKPRGGLSSIGSRTSRKSPPTRPTANPASPPSNISARSNKPPISSRPSATRTSPSSTASAPPAYAAAS